MGKSCFRFVPVVVVFLTALPSVGKSAFVVYSLTANGGLAGFNAAAGSPPVSIDFDSLAAGTNIGGSTIAGVTFNAPAGGAPLIVVQGSATTTPVGFSGVISAALNKLLPTSGLNVLSPGGTTLGPGPNDPVENDDLELVFSSPLVAFGFDHLSQSADGVSGTTFQVFNAANSLVLSGTIPISNIGGVGGGAAGGANFWGVVATGVDQIGRIVVNDQDGNAVFPDSNIGFDTFRFVAPTDPVPEPSSLVLFGLGSFAMGLSFRWRRK